MGIFNKINIIKANIFYSQGNLEEALKIYKKLAESKKLENAVKLQGAYAAINCGDLKYAKIFLDKINYNKLENDNYKISYKQTESLYFWRTGHLDLAIKNLKSLDKEFENTATYETLGYLLILNKDYDEALKYNTKAYEYNHSNIIADNLAESYYYLNNYDKAYEIYKNIFNKETLPNFPEPYYFFALTILKKGYSYGENYKEDALKYLNTALSKKESFLSDLNKDIINKEIEKLKK
ncbi:tetratricopeptide repeat protein [Clostridium sp. HCP1S3_B4]|uniref:tetratricopeptide repeat protein n=1 Tax=unclassified Clostridium TaxID=2614128 RepID=UPI003F8919C5|nr:hypothetical protein [Clostridiales bacterium]